jgi:hypothetical protein
MKPSGPTLSNTSIAVHSALQNEQKYSFFSFTGTVVP